MWTSHFREQDRKEGTKGVMSEWCMGNRVIDSRESVQMYVHIPSMTKTIVKFGVGSPRVYYIYIAFIC